MGKVGRGRLGDGDDLRRVRLGIGARAQVEDPDDEGGEREDGGDGRPAGRAEEGASAVKLELAVAGLLSGGEVAELGFEALDAGAGGVAVVSVVGICR